MPLSFPPSPTLGQVESYNGKNWRWMGAYWSAVSQFAPAPDGSAFGFPYSAEVLWKEVLVTAGLEGIVVNSLATELTYI